MPRKILIDQRLEERPASLNISSTGDTIDVCQLISNCDYPHNKNNPSTAIMVYVDTKLHMPNKTHIRYGNIATFYLPNLITFALELKILNPLS